MVPEAGDRIPPVFHSGLGIWFCLPHGGMCVPTRSGTDLTGVDHAKTRLRFSGPGFTKSLDL